jgi:gamma-glutamylaminecyclotransferase
VERALLFVYGTLRRGFANAQCMGSATFERAAATAPAYSLYDFGAYPALVQGGDGVVVGELYRVSDAELTRLDEFEGCPELYQRVLVDLDDGTQAFSYVMAAERLIGCARIPGGDFAAHGRTPKPPGPEE